MANRVGEYVKAVEDKYRRLNVARRIAENALELSTLEGSQLRRVCMTQHYMQRIFSGVDAWELARKNAGYVFPARPPVLRNGEIVELLRDIDRFYLKRFHSLSTEEQSNVHRRWFAALDAVNNRTMDEEEYNYIMRVGKKDPGKLIDLWKRSAEVMKVA